LCCGRTEQELKARGLVLVPDHVIPLGEGSNSIENIQPLCHSLQKGRWFEGCNNQKGTNCTDYRPAVTDGSRISVVWDCQKFNLTSGTSQEVTP
jgi:hypothetical protein